MTNISFEILSRKKIEEYIFDNDFNYYIISVLEPGQPAIKLKNNFSINKNNYTTLVCDDIDDIYNALKYRTIKVPSSNDIVEMLNNITKFIKENENVKILAHCNQGINRSAGVVSALSTIYTNNDVTVGNDLVWPNKFLKELISDTYRKEIQNEQ